MSVNYQVLQTPKRYGILYAEEVGSSFETCWYETSYDRDSAIAHIKLHGQLELFSPHSPIGRTVNVYAFSSIDALSEYCKQIENAVVGFVV